MLHIFSILYLDSYNSTYEILNKNLKKVYFLTIEINKKIYLDDFINIKLKEDLFIFKKFLDDFFNFLIGIV